MDRTSMQPVAATFICALGISVAACGGGGGGSKDSGPAATISNSAPTAAFTVTQSSGVAPLTVQFDASGSSDSDGTISA